jgi:hypothetical protein
VPGGTQSRWSEIHHLVHWDDGGVTAAWNLLALCAHTITAGITAGGLGIGGNADLADGVVFGDPAGGGVPRVWGATGERGGSR